MRGIRLLFGIYGKKAHLQIILRPRIFLKKVRIYYEILKTIFKMTLLQFDFLHHFSGGRTRWGLTSRNFLEDRIEEPLQPLDQLRPPEHHRPEHQIIFLLSFPAFFAKLPSGAHIQKDPTPKKRNKELKNVQWKPEGWILSPDRPIRSGPHCRPEADQHQHPMAPGFWQQNASLQVENCSCLLWSRFSSSLMTSPCVSFHLSSILMASSKSPLNKASAQGDKWPFAGLTSRLLTQTFLNT